MLATVHIRGRRAVVFRQVLAVQTVPARHCALTRAVKLKTRGFSLGVKINGTNPFLARDQRVRSPASSQARPLCGYPTKG